MEYKTRKLHGKNRTRMIAHRGVSGLECENTIAAFVAAGNRSYYGIETDVHVTGDGRYIIFHDDDTTRLTGSTLEVEKTDFDTLRRMRLTNPRTGLSRADWFMPTVEEYISVCKAYHKIAVLELKNRMTPGQIGGIVRIIRRCGYLGHTVFISFHLENLTDLRSIYPKAHAQYLVGKDAVYADLPAFLRMMRENHLDIDIQECLLTPELSATLHENGIKINVWTPDRVEDGRHLIECGVDYITTNILE